MKNQVLQKDFNSYGSRRGNHEVMKIITFANMVERNMHVVIYYLSGYIFKNTIQMVQIQKLLIMKNNYKK